MVPPVSPQRKKERKEEKRKVFIRKNINKNCKIGNN
jgi:hypothetical protein